MRNLATEILVNKRDFFIEKVKAPLFKAITLLGKRYPEPIHKNVGHPNSHLLIDIFDNVLEYETNEKILQLIKSFKNIVIGEYEHDGMYKDRMDFGLEKIVEKIVSGEWQPRQINRPYQYWAEAREDKLQKRKLFGSIFRGMRSQSDLRDGFLGEVE